MINNRPAFIEADFRKSSKSEAQTDCVHVGRRNGRVQVRDTKTVFDSLNDHRLAFTSEQFNQLLAITKKQQP
jgi:uncharacterized protein DUF397